MTGTYAARMFALFMMLAGLPALGGCAWLNSALSGASPDASASSSTASGSSSAGPSTSPSAPGVSAGDVRSSLLPLLSPEGERRLMEAKSLWIEDDCVDPERSALLLDVVLEETPDYADALIWRGKALTAQNYLEDAFDDLTKAVQLLSGVKSAEAARQRARAYAARALVALRMQREQGAERDLASALEADPAEPTIYLYRGALEFLRGKNAEGCAALRQACGLGMCGARKRAESDGICR